MKKTVLPPLAAWEHVGWRERRPRRFAPRSVRWIGTPDWSLRRAPAREAEKDCRLVDQTARRNRSCPAGGGAGLGDGPEWLTRCGLVEMWSRGVFLQRTDRALSRAPRWGAALRADGGLAVLHLRARRRAALASSWSTPSPFLCPAHHGAAQK